MSYGLYNLYDNDVTWMKENDEYRQFIMYLLQVSYVTLSLGQLLTAEYNQLLYLVYY